MRGLPPRLLCKYHKHVLMLLTCRHRLIDDEQIIATDESADCCWLCGAYLCSVHAGSASSLLLCPSLPRALADDAPAALCAFNEPTKDPFDPTEVERDGCLDCGSSTCLHGAQQVRLLSFLVSESLLLTLCTVRRPAIRLTTTRSTPFEMRSRRRFSTRACRRSTAARQASSYSASLTRCVIVDVELLRLR